jgi:hypothetical protein
LRDKSHGEANTPRIETHIFQIDPKGGIFVALIDGRGAVVDSRRQQFSIADQAQILLVVLDHNRADNTSEISPARLEEHSEFMSQLRGHMKQRQQKEKLKIICCLNKSDLWMRDKPDRILHLKKWFSDQVNEWRKLNISISEKPVEIAAKTGFNVNLVKAEILVAAEQEK